MRRGTLLAGLLIVGVIGPGVSGADFVQRGLAPVSNQQEDGWEDLILLLDSMCESAVCRHARVVGEVSAISKLDSIVAEYDARGVNPNMTAVQRETAKLSVMAGRHWLDKYPGWLDVAAEEDFVRLLEGVEGAL